MSIRTDFSGYVRRYNGGDIETQHRFGVSKVVTEYGGRPISIANGSSDISIMPSGLVSAKTVCILPNKKINITLNASINASMDIFADGLFILTGSVSDVKLKNESGAAANVIYDISG